MLQIQMSAEEVLLLREILESYMGDLRAEVHHTDTFLKFQYKRSP